jgi:hypothetical protein
MLSRQRAVILRNVAICGEMLACWAMVSRVMLFFENLRMDPVNIRPVEGRRQLQHTDPVCHEADPDVGIPVEANG